MSSKKFFSVIALTFFLFIIVFGSAGCRGGSSSNFENNDNPAPNPEPSPTPEPTPSPNLHLLVRL